MSTPKETEERIAYLISERSVMKAMEGVFRKKRDKNGHLFGFVPHTYFFLFEPFTNICIADLTNVSSVTGGTFWFSL